MRWQLRYGITDELGSSAPVDGSENNTLWRKGLELIDELLTLEQIEACLDKNEYDVEQFITFFRLIDFSERVTVVSRSQT